MISLRTTIDQMMTTYGQNVTITHAGADHTLRGLVTPMDATNTNVFFDANEQVGLLKPAALLYVSGSESQPPVTSDIFYDADIRAPANTLFTVQKVYGVRLSGSIALWICLCD